MNTRADRLIRRLEKFCPIGDEEKQALLQAMTRDQHFEPGDTLIQERKPTEGVFVITDGFACRSRLLPNGRRQIVGVLLPGDLCDLGVVMLKRMDHSIAALSPVTASLIPSEAVTQLLDHKPRLSHALWWTSMVEHSITRQWVVNVGYRTAFERVAHLFCELFCRLEAVGLTRQNKCELPLTQIELGDTVALSSVHVNRTLMYMRRANLVRLHGGQLELLNRDALETAAGFDPDYLHLEGCQPAPTRSPAGYAALT